MKEPEEESLARPSSTGVAGPLLAAVSYFVLLAGFGLAAHFFGLNRSLGPRFTALFLSFSLLLAPYWAFGFGLADFLRSKLRTWRTQILLPAFLTLPYLISTVPFGDCRPQYALAFSGLPVGMAALLASTSSRRGLFWPDAVVLLAVGLPVEFGWFRGAWPEPGLAALPKLLLMNATLYSFLVIRPAEGTGYDFRPHWRDLGVGLREWAFFAPLAITVGVALGFIQPHALKAGPPAMAAAWLVTFFFVALPEELFFRGLLQNRLEQRLAAAGYERGGILAAAIASLVFGLSHFNKPGPFNWRYVLLATIAGLFYGRAWRDRHRLFCSSITHTTVDVVWSLWFR